MDASIKLEFLLVSNPRSIFKNIYLKHENTEDLQMDKVRKVTTGRVGGLYKDLEAHTDTEICWSFADK